MKKWKSWQIIEAHNVPLGNQELLSKPCPQKLRIFETETLEGTWQAEHNTELYGRTSLQDLELTGAHPWDTVQPFRIMIDHLFAQKTATITIVSTVGIKLTNDWRITT